jgi:hypothetical protein
MVRRLRAIPRPQWPGGHMGEKLDEILDVTP